MKTYNANIIFDDEKEEETQVCGESASDALNVVYDYLHDMRKSLADIKKIELEQTCNADDSEYYGDKYEHFEIDRVS